MQDHRQKVWLSERAGKDINVLELFVFEEFECSPEEKVRPTVVVLRGHAEVVPAILIFGLLLHGDAVPFVSGRAVPLAFRPVDCALHYFRAKVLGISLELDRVGNLLVGNIESLRQYQSAILHRNL